MENNEMSPFLQFGKYLDYLKSSIMKADEKSFYYLYIIHSDNSSLEQKITSIVELINLHRNNFNGYCTIGELYYFISLFDQIKEKNEEYKQKEKVVYNEIIIRLQEEKMKYEATSIITIAKKVFLNDMEELKLLLDFYLSFYAKIENSSHKIAKTLFEKWGEEMKTNLLLLKNSIKFNIDDIQSDNEDIYLISKEWYTNFSSWVSEISEKKEIKGIEDIKINTMPCQIYNNDIITFKKTSISYKNKHDNLTIKKGEEGNIMYVSKKNWQTLVDIFGCEFEYFIHHKQFNCCIIKVYIFYKANPRLLLLPIEIEVDSSLRKIEDFKNKIIRSINGINLSKSENYSINLFGSFIFTDELMLKLIFAYMFDVPQFKMECKDISTIDELVTNQIIICDIFDKANKLNYIKSIHFDLLTNNLQCNGCITILDKVHLKCSFCSYGYYCCEKCKYLSASHCRVHFILENFFNVPTKFDAIDMFYKYSSIKHKIQDNRIGFPNLGNSCYLASSMISLYHCYTFVNLLFSLQNSIENSKNCDIAKACINLANSYFNLKRNYLFEGNQGEYNHFRRCLPDFYYKFINKNNFSTRAEDAREFMVKLIDNLDNDIKSVKGKDCQFIERLFKGRIKKVLNCHKCNNNSVSYDDFLFLQLCIQKGDYKCVEIKFFPYSHKENILRCHIYTIRISKFTKYSDLKKEITNLYNKPISYLIGVELDANNNITTIIKETEDIENIASYFESKKEIVFYEAPLSQYIFIEPIQIIEEEKYSTLTYPFIVEIKKDMTFKDFHNEIKEVISHILLSNSLLTLYIKHNNWVIIEKTCRFCNNNLIKYCSLMVNYNEDECIDKITPKLSTPPVLLLDISSYDPNKTLYDKLEMILLPKENSLIITKDETTLEKCIEKYMEKEEFNEDNKYLCSHCNSLQDATKRMLFDSMPYYLIFQFIRNKDVTKDISNNIFLNLIGCNTNKDKTTVHFPMILIPSYECKDEYELFAVICHTKKYVVWHYFTVVKESDGKWYKYDDDKVKEYTIQKIKKEAYMLMYKKKISI